MVKNLKSLQSIVILNELERIYQTAILDTVERETWNHEYEALEFKLFEYRFKSRLAKRPQRKRGTLSLYGKKILINKIPHYILTK